MWLTFAPASANALETSRPIPRAPPVTRCYSKRLLTIGIIGRYRTSHNCDLAREIEGLHDMLIWGLREDHFVV